MCSASGLQMLVCILLLEGRFCVEEFLVASSPSTYFFPRGGMKDVDSA